MYGNFPGTDDRRHTEGIQSYNRKIIMQITKDNIENIFNNKIKELTTVTVDNCLDIFVNFYNNNFISEVDTNFPENDMLLFEYGIYDSQDGKVENFTVGLTRQFYIGKNEEGDLFNLQLLLYFDKHNFIGIEPYNRWSDEFSTIEDWTKKIKRTDGFEQTENIIPKSFEIFLTNPGI